MDSAENPVRFTGLKLGPPKTVAAGIPAVVYSMRHILEEMNVFRGMKALMKLNQKDGFDCPGCAWPDPDDERSGIAEYCENGAKAIAEEATTRKLTPEFFAQNSVAELGLLTDYEIGKKGRIAQPMYLAAGATHYTPISWTAAYQTIAGHLHKLSSPNEAIFYTSGRTSNEAAFLYQLMVREYGTNNLPDCSNMCHESSGVALGESLGIGKGSVTLEDIYEAEVIIILGQNPGTNHPRMLTALQKAKANGATIIAVNPLPETGLLNFLNPQTVKGILNIKTQLTDIFLQVKINGDMALLKALSLLLLQEEEKIPGSVFDQDFIEKNTIDYAAYIQHLKLQQLPQLAADSGVPLEMIQQAANALLHKKKIIACWAMGLTQHKNAVATIKEVVNLLLLKGSIGKPGAGTCPVRGHSNVQGDRTMGIYEQPSAGLLSKLHAVYGFTPPQAHGYDVVKAIHAMHRGDAKVFMAMGGNFLSATPDTLFTAQALRNCDLTVHVSTKLNRSHVVHGKEALILPCLGRSDKDIQNGEQQFVTCENSMGVVQLSKGNLHPVSDQLKSEPEIVCDLAKALLGEDSRVPWEQYAQHYDYIRNDIEKVIPGFDDYNKRVRHPGGFYLPNGARQGRFNTNSGKAHFHVADVLTTPLAADEYMMMTIRSHDQFNTTIYGLDDRYRGVYHERRVIFMHPGDIAAAGFHPGDVVDLYNYYGQTERVAHGFIIVSFQIPEKCTATYFPETNVLVPVDSVAEKSNTPTSKLVIIKIKSSIIKK
ncbi:molybdopterin-dependent oxidoreductase alpha subunit [Chitinophaga niastensis]|uniref:Molybdopterin-dependent oxidoreductase alpha subunit n=1 Tax=Chitinophaga niastensis TaxID=536980 RepID=A0A2P8HAZ7_CHINA|nr:FdhF/YdeP family oxidoreductase [Chitinophaga niastensis]PSL43380.1 molybdopterin-dependent oxidoreductase alpha subunit [Chitinophaga niastensis]